MCDPIRLAMLAAIRACVGLLLLAGSATAHVLERLPAGHWYQVPRSNVDSVFPKRNPQGWTGPRSIMDAWSGGAYDSLRDRLIVWGGGHMDYAGNEVYVFDVNSLAWTRLTEPTPDRQVIANAARYADGRPSSRHTYNYLQYSPEIDSLVSLGNSASYGDQSTGGDGNAVDAFNFLTKRWDSRADKPPNGHTIGAISAYDPSTGKLWHHGCLSHDGSLVAYDSSKDTWSGPYGEYYIEYYATAAVDPNRHIMVATGGNQNNKVLVWDLNHPGNPEEIATSGDRMLESAQAPGFVYDSAVDKFVGWSGGASVYTLDADSWIWTRVNPSVTNTVVPTAPNETGTYGRFRYIPSKNVFVLVNRTDENVYFYKLNKEAGAKTTPSARPSNVTMVRGGGAIDLSTLLLMLATLCVQVMRERNLSCRANRVREHFGESLE